MTHPPTSSNVAADTADERVGSAYKIVGSSLGAAARGVGSFFRRDERHREQEEENLSTPRRRPRRGEREDHDNYNDYDDHQEHDEPAGPRISTFESHADAWGLVLIGLAAIIGGSVWFDVAGPVGDLISTGTHWLIGAGALILPVLLIGIAIALMLNVRASDTVRARVALGFGIIAVAMLGLIHVFAGNPAEWAERKIAGGAIGAFTGGLLAAGFSSYVAVPLLGLIVLLAIAAPLRNFYEGRAEIARAEESIARLEAQKQALESDIAMYEDDAFIRQEARRRLGVVEEGETVWRIIDPRMSAPDNITTAADDTPDDREWSEVLWDSLRAVPAAGEEEHVGE